MLQSPKNPDSVSTPLTYRFHRLELPYTKIIESIPLMEAKISQSPILNDYGIRNLHHPDDTYNFMTTYNQTFLASPDPLRMIDEVEALTFPEERTFVLTLWGKIIGFIYVTIEDDPLGSGDTVGAIAAIGTLPAYRGKKIALMLLKHALMYFSDKSITKVICEVYEKNKPSLQFFKGFGMRIVGEMIL